MPLTPGTRLGPYEVLALLGAGGMGEVWRAHDPRLSRAVAIKALPAAFAQDPERLALRARGPRGGVAQPPEGGHAVLHWDAEMGFERFAGLPISPDGERVVLRKASGGYVSHSLQGKTETPLAALLGTRRPLGFDVGGGGQYVSNVTHAARSADEFVVGRAADSP